jgi:hypothetical protein
VEPQYDINVKNFLSLEIFLDLTKEELISPILSSYCENDGKIEPFRELKEWNKNEEIKSEHIPAWWSAYNKIKHDTENIEKYATLDNSIHSLAGVFVLIKSIYGKGLINGLLVKPNKQPSEKYFYETPKSRLYLSMAYKTKL